MASGIKRFRIDIHPESSADLSNEAFDNIEKQMLLQFDAWLSEHPTARIIGSKFGRESGRSLDPSESSHCCFLAVLYIE